MIREEVEFFMDIIQDSRADARIIDRYYTLIDFIFSNVGLDWRKEGLSIKTTGDEKIMNFLEATEPRRYKLTVEQLQNERAKEEKNKEQ